MQVQSLGQEDPLEEGMATHSSLLAWRIPWTDKNLPGKCRRLKRCRFNPWVRKIPWRRAWQPTPVFLPGESHGQTKPTGLQSIGSQRVGHDRSDLAPLLEPEGRRGLSPGVNSRSWVGLRSHLTP